MPELKYVIKTEADLSAARQLTAEFDKQTKQIKAETAAANELKAAIAAVEKEKASKKSVQDAKENAEALSSLTRATKEVGVEAEKTGVSKAKLAKALKQLKQEIPGLGAAIHLLTNPYATVATAIAGFILAIKKQIDAQNEAARSSAALSASLDPVVVNTISHQQESAKAAVSTLEHADAMARAAHEASGLDAALGKTLGKIDQDARIKQASLNLEKQRALRGVTDPEQRAAIELDFAERGRTLAADTERSKAIQIAEADRKARQAAQDAGVVLPEARGILSEMEQEKKRRDAMRAAGGSDLNILQTALAEAELRGPQGERGLVGRAFDLATGRKSFQSADEIRAEILNRKTQQDALASDEVFESGELNRQRQHVRSLEAQELSGGRFGSQRQSAIAAADTSRRVAAIENQAAREEHAGNAELESAKIARQLAEALQKEENQRQARESKRIERQIKEVNRVH